MDVSEYISLYTNETGEILQALEEGLMEFENNSDASAIDELFRHAHNLKGMSGTMGFESVVEASHSLENILDDLRNGRSELRKDQASALLKVVDLLREMVSGVVDAGESDKTRSVLGEIVAILNSSFTNIDYEKEASCGCPVGASGDEKYVEELETEGKSESPVEGTQAAEERNESESGQKREPDDAEARSGVSGENTESSGEDTKTVKDLNAAYYSRISSTRVELNRLDDLMDLVGELIISRIRLSNIAEGIESKILHEELTASGRLISEIQKEVVEARLVPAGNVFQRFKRLVRDISTKLDKKAKFTIIGADIGLDKMVLETMIDPLIHLIRNSIDHGIEAPEERKAAGKDETGAITLSARRERNFVIIELSDDGRGIDVSQVSRKVGSAGGGKEDSEITDEELCRILTSPGFSTRDKANKFSGRGVGMNAVKEAVDSLGGSMSLKNKVGEGTTIFLHLPINLSIIKALLFQVGGEVHALPVEYIKETTRIDPSSIQTAGGSEVFITQEGPVAVIRPINIFGIGSAEVKGRYIKMIVLETEMSRGGMVVDRILGQQDVVIKGLPEIIRGMEGISGATVLGSGEIAFIWDPRYLLKERHNNESDKEAVLSED